MPNCGSVVARITHIGEDFVLAVWEDDLGIQQVRMYELVKHQDPIERPPAYP